LKKVGVEKYEIPTYGKGTQWWKFLQFIETTDCHYKTKIVNGKKGKYFCGVKKRENYNTASTFMNRLTTKEPEKEFSLLNEIATGDSSFTQYVNKGNELHERYEKGEISLENEAADEDEFFKRLEEQN
jgi:hypothetical protein